MNILDVIEVSKQYYQHKALDKISISVKEGSIYGLLGPNGAGKTTLIRIITKIISPDEGKVLLNNQPISDDDVTKIGYLPEERGLYKNVKVFDQLLYLSQLKGLEKFSAIERINYWLKKLNINEWKNKKVSDLSKGMQQKIQFIATVLHSPKLMILDEPFSGFDPINAEIIKNEIINLKKEGTTIILSTHNMNSVEELCDDIALIHQAKVVLSGNVFELKKQYSDAVYQIMFKGNLQAFTHALWASAELISTKEIHNNILARIKLKPKITINKILQQILPVCEIIFVKEELLSMNDIFIKTVGQSINVSESILTE
ncbi:MAG TPA: ATP-binding cassette domain-containing protein [Bacteroidia bacterium]|nr:ATP-binding cassette domain-containing protein [Bacteroidia bacterium]